MDRLGPGMWLSCQALAEEFNDQPKVYKRLLIAIFRKIPCNVCSRDAFNYLTRHEIVIPVEWICDFHNYVNQKTGKPIVPCKRFTSARVEGNAGKV